MIPWAYKMRAECMRDVIEFLKVVRVASYTIISTDAAWSGDVTCEFTSALTLSEIKRAMVGISDGHVMLETVELATSYTGDRQ